VTLAVDKALRQAQSHIKVGELTEAEELYKQVLFKFPKNKKAIQGYQKLKGGIASEGSSTSEPQQEQVQELLSLYNQGQFKEVLSKIKPLISVFSKAITLFNLQGSILLDHIGAFGLPIREIGTLRLLGIHLVFSGVILAHYGQYAGRARRSPSVCARSGKT
jgi:tetratricopeptide (TPR) repeat protein